MLTILKDPNPIQDEKNFNFNNAFLSLALFGQTKNKILVGAESGININQSDYVYNKAKITLQGDLLAEYYASKKFSIMGKLKYYQNNVISNYSRIIGSNWFGN